MTTALQRRVTDLQAEIRQYEREFAEDLRRAKDRFETNTGLVITGMSVSVATHTTLRSDEGHEGRRIDTSVITDIALNHTGKL